MLSIILSNYEWTYIYEVSLLVLEDLESEIVRDRHSETKGNRITLILIYPTQTPITPLPNVMSAYLLGVYVYLWSSPWSRKTTETRVPIDGNSNAITFLLQNRNTSKSVCSFVYLCIRMAAKLVVQRGGSWNAKIIACSCVFTKYAGNITLE